MASAMTKANINDGLPEELQKSLSSQRQAVWRPLIPSVSLQAISISGCSLVQKRETTGGYTPEINEI